MTPDELPDLFDLILGYTPGFSMSDRISAVWAYQMADIGRADARDAVHAHYASENRWITVADVRRRVAGSAGVLPPDADEALTQATAWLDWRGAPWDTPRSEEAPKLHPAVRRAARQIGWDALATMLDESPITVVRADWRKTYAKIAQDVERVALAPGGIAATRELAARQAIEAATYLPTPIPKLVADPQGVVRRDRMLARIGLGGRASRAIGTTS